ncbi:hypothetical protein FRIGORI9N_420125 [Frigoribacterium sp. 9N]|nr:hypothetical protein FRIGORI9N_420125 [Frigoribacterium sp. 9N]
MPVRSLSSGASFCNLKGLDLAASLNTYIEPSALQFSCHALVRLSHCQDGGSFDPVSEVVIREQHLGPGLDIRQAPKMHGALQLSRGDAEPPQCRRLRCGLVGVVGGIVHAHVPSGGGRNRHRKRTCRFRPLVCGGASTGPSGTYVLFNCGSGANSR